MLEKLDKPLNESQQRRLLQECREKKEGLHPNTRSLSIDLSVIGLKKEIRLTTAAFYEQCKTLLEKTITMVEHAISQAVQRLEIDNTSIHAIYAVGGSTALPAVGRMLREAYGRRLRRSLHPYGATAIGLSIRADAQAGYSLRERFTRHFGVWREKEAGSAASFDPIFEKDTLLPAENEPPLEHVRSYWPTHNMGYFRYLEASHLNANGLPCGELTPWEEVLFPFEPQLQATKNLASVEVHNSGQASGQLIEERYSCDAQGILSVTIRNQNTGYERTFNLL